MAPTGKREGEGTWTYVKGTGRFEGIQGEGTSSGISHVWYSDGRGVYAPVRTSEPLQIFY